MVLFFSLIRHFLRICGEDSVREMQYVAYFSDSGKTFVVNNHWKRSVTSNSQHNVFMAFKIK